MKETNSKFKIILLSTGGTIEKTYDEIAGTLENNNSTVEKRIIKKLRLPYSEIEHHVLMSKDSLYMDDEDREKICKEIALSEEKGQAIVVLHGTDTMVKTFYHCAHQLPHFKVPVVFTGAMRPLGFEDSDAFQNVTEALLSVKILSPGFYIVFHNQIFSSSMKVQKNLKKATFEVS